MIEQTEQIIRSKALASKLYDTWVRQRQDRPKVKYPKTESELKDISKENFKNQFAAPRQKHLEQLRKVAKEMSIADKVALLVMLELPTVEASTLLHRLSMQLVQNPDATYFSKVNQEENCGTGCG